MSGVFTFCLVAFAWIFFRANNIGDAFLIVKHIATGYHQVSFVVPVINLSNQGEFGRLAILTGVVMSIFMFISEAWLSVRLANLGNKPILDFLYCSFTLTMILLFGIFHNNSFIYFQF